MLVHVDMLRIVLSLKKRVWKVVVAHTPIQSTQRMRATKCFFGALDGETVFPRSGAA